MPTDEPESLSSIYFPLRLTYGLVPVIAGLDKFFNLLTDWGKYLPRGLASGLPVPASTFMIVVGCIEIVAGLAVLTKFTRLGAYVVMAWLVTIAVNLVAAGYLDIAVRDLVMAVGAFSLGQAAAFRHEAWLPFGGPPGRRKHMPMFVEHAIPSEDRPGLAAEALADEEIVRRVLAGDSASFELIMRRYNRPITCLIASSSPLLQQELPHRSL